MERPYLVLWFAIALFLVLGVWGIYNHLQPAPAPPSAAQDQPTTQPTLVERLRAERARRMAERERGVPATTSTSPSL
jgi:hypothetical protein